MRVFYNLMMARSKPEHPVPPGSSLEHLEHIAGIFLMNQYFFSLGVTLDISSTLPQLFSQLDGDPARMRTC